MLSPHLLHAFLLQLLIVFAEVDPWFDQDSQREIEAFQSEIERFDAFVFPP